MDLRCQLRTEHREFSELDGLTVMTRVAIYSEDRTLQPLLSSALGKDFEVLLESDGEGMDALIAAGGCDVLILDLCRHEDSLETAIHNLLAATNT